MASFLKPLSSFMAMAEIVPTIVEITVATTATISVVQREDKIAGSANKFLYHFRVKPAQDPLSLELLKLKTTRMIIGAYKNKNTKNK